MLKRKERLDSKLFTYTFKQGKRLNKEHITAIFLPETSFKASVVVSKKIEKRAVKRNLWRRRVYSLLREVKSDLGFEKGGYYIFLLKVKGVKLSKKKFKQIVKTQIKEILKLN